MAYRYGTRERREQLLSEAQELIEREYRRKLTLSVLARELATSPRQLQRVFADAGTSFREQVRRVRMRHARDLLDADVVPIGQVAASVGYRQPHQFSKSFRRHHGEAPRAYRRHRREDAGVPLAA